MNNLLRLSAIIGAVIFTMAFTFNNGINDDSSRFIQKNDDEGIKFMNLTYDEAIKLSAQTGKPIFIDCYTEWCGPCKMLSKNTFTDSNVGNFFNKNFINIKIEMEKDADGPNLARMFRVRAYPTMLYVNGKGELIKQSLGYVTPDQLLSVATQVIN
ncbi:MAG: thioredoxin family protein [Crocinitomicaceae bacterium]|nr:thioredoxin family protein [Crocinitomicaceae bacterium]